VTEQNQHSELGNVILDGIYASDDDNVRKDAAQVAVARLEEQLEELRRIEDAAAAFLTACDEQGCSDAPLNEFCGLVEAVSRLPGPGSIPAIKPGRSAASGGVPVKGGESPSPGYDSPPSFPASKPPDTRTPEQVDFDEAMEAAENEAMEAAENASSPASTPDASKGNTDA
jgi:hypothetical protein